MTVEGVRHNPSNPDVWILEYHLDGYHSPIMKRGPFPDIQEARDHASTMADAWGYAQRPNPEELAEPMFVGQQIPVNRVTRRRS